jgi:hypothetical protein
MHQKVILLASCYTPHPQFLHGVQLYTKPTF